MLGSMDPLTTLLLLTLPPYVLGFLLLSRLRLQGHAWALGVTAVLLGGTAAAYGLVLLYDRVA